MKLTVFPQKHGFLCGKTRTALRKKHFFYEQGRTDLCAQTRTFCRNAGKNGPQGGPQPCFSLLFSLFDADAGLLPKYQKESGTTLQLTHTAIFHAQHRTAAHTRQAKTVFR